MLFIRRKPMRIPEPELSREELEELVRENFHFAKEYADAGNVSGMEMSLEEMTKYGQKIGMKFSSDEISKIKLIGYERGAELMRKNAEELRKANKIRESQNADTLADNYANEAKMIKLALR
jgi:hypothetical protein